MLQIFSLLAFGFLFGIKHAFDADHIAAVSLLSLSAENKRSTIFRGIFWGFGHSVTIIVLGIIVLVFGLRIPETWRQFFESIVAVFLIFYGSYIMIRFWRTRKKIPAGVLHNHPPAGSHFHPAPSFLVGILHGLAGSGAIFVLVISTLQSVWLGLMYILFFSIGSIFGMSLAAFLLSKIIVRFQNIFTAVFSVISIVIGFRMLA